MDDIEVLIEALRRIERMTLREPHVRPTEIGLIARAALNKVTA